MPKQTKLDENAVIYQPRKELTEKEKLKDMSLRKKFSYLWEYYKIHAAVVIVVTSLSLYILHNILTPNIETEFYAAMIDNTIATDVLEEFKVDFSDYLQLDATTETIEFNSSFYFKNGNDPMMDMKQVLTTYVAAKQVDVIIAPESVFYDYAYYGYMDKLSDQLPTDVYSSLTDHFYITSLEEDPEVNVYGIYLTDTKLYNNANNSDPYVLGIVVNSEHKDNVVEFLRYIFKY